ncbi:hypothetical protein [Campylobacter insulaenigrae]|uniref:hypothetical protein n=1 Tax=Campylobacter insulaenigrae TaxID=260714 RepID=UPI002430E1A1|nr:hypothetical protein [Campylobacter insulaenigrae]
MKKSFVMIYVVFLVIFISFLSMFIVKTLSYSSRIMKDYIFYTQGKILLYDFKEISKYFLYEAKKEGKECLENLKLNYNGILISIDYIYPLAKCINEKVISNYQQADSIIAVNIGILLNTDKGVNEEIFLQKSFFIYPKFDKYKF